jgi:hypothetical protein
MAAMGNQAQPGGAFFLTRVLLRDDGEGNNDAVKGQGRGATSPGP